MPSQVKPQMNQTTKMVAQAWLDFFFMDLSLVHLDNIELSIQVCLIIWNF